MWNAPTLIRRAELKAFSHIPLSGLVLDLGGVKHSSYLSAFHGKFSVTTVNMDERTNPDIIHDLEKPLPIREGTYDSVLLINVLEHVFDYRVLLKESARVVKQGGVAVVAAPFLFPFHGSPDDFHRFTGAALRRELEIAGFSRVSLKTLGGGIFSLHYLFFDRLLPSRLRFLNYHTFRYVVVFLDFLFERAARLLGKKYMPDDYAFGYCAVGIKK